jgi:L-iditol 2-dehydrogenase
MRIAVLTAPQTFQVVDEPTPELRRDQVLVQVAACGVCAADVDVFEGLSAEDFPRYLGHEVSGTVVETGSEVTTLRVGDAVAVWTTGHGFAEQVAVDADHCRPVAGVALSEALLEPLACAVNAVEAADVRMGDDVVIIGAGFMGHLVQLLVRLRGARQVVVADTRADALDRAAALGADCIVDVTSQSLADIVRELTHGEGSDVTFEVTGAQGPLSTAGEVTRMSGRIVLVGFHQGPARELPLGHWNWMAFQIVNAHFRDPATIMRGMTVGARLLSSGRLSLAGLISHRFSLDDVGSAFAMARDKPLGFVKATVVPEASS